MNNKRLISVAVLDDHQSTIDGYEFRLKESPNIVLRVRASHAEELQKALEDTPVDVLLLDISVPNSGSDKNQIPLLFFVPQLLAQYPQLKILVISMHNEANLIQSVMDAGARGYIVKDDRASITKLSEIIELVAAGGYYFSDHSFKSLFAEERKGKIPKLPTARQLQALSLCASLPDSNSDEIATMLNVASSTLRNLLSDCYKRLGVQNRASAVEEARRLGLISPPAP